MQTPHELVQFVRSRASYAWSASENPNSFELVSQVWMGAEWRHEVVVVGSHFKSDATMVYITGGDVNEPDLEEAMAISNRSGLPVAMLFNIPNQPLFEMREDDLIAHTFQRFIDTGEVEWPLLFPMARAAIRCLDMLGESMGFKRFVVMGASKRGWTTWLAAATGDPRIIGIIPMVIDHLNFPAQMKHQIETWGVYSEQIADYTERDLPSQIDSERGAHLARMMDPFHYLNEIRCPILIVNGANDRYWTVDALSLYWQFLNDAKRCVIVPNAGHLLGDKSMMIESASAFSQACAAGAQLPEIEASFIRVANEIRAEIHADEATETRMWTALSSSLDFRDSEWQFPCPTVPKGLNAAAFVEARFEGATGPYSLSTPVKVLPA